MYEIEQSDDYGRRRKRFDKKHHDELIAVLDNLDLFHKGLNDGLKLEQVRLYGFVHPEPHGVLAITQKGHGANLAQTRLYVYVDTEAHVIHLITLGDKGSQHEDIKTCTNFVMELRKEEEKNYAEE